MSAFSSYHPITLFLYFVSVTLLTMFTMNPVFLVLSLVCSSAFCAILHRPKEFWSNLAYYTPMFLLIAVTNPLFSHNGETPLFFLNDNPVTLEAILYGAAISTMLISIIFWFKCYHEIMSSDKFLYLFGKIIPKLALVVSMAIRFVPTFKSQIKKISLTQKTLGLYASNSITDRLFGCFRVFSILITWSLENAVETADSMKARGYGLKGRKSFSLFRFQAKDGVLLCINILMLAVVLFGAEQNSTRVSFYPGISYARLSPLSVGVYLALFILMILPFVIEVKEKITWKLLKSKI